MKRGLITIENSGISVCVFDENERGRVSTRFNAVTIENLNEAARLAASWGDVPYDDRKREIHRIHDTEQFRALLRETIDNFT